MEKFWRTLRWPPRRLVLWHSIAAIPMATVVVLGASLSYHYHQLSIENRDRVDRAYAVLDVVDGLYISVQNADVALRDIGVLHGDVEPVHHVEHRVGAVDPVAVLDRQLVVVVRQGGAQHHDRRHRDGGDRMPQHQPPGRPAQRPPELLHESATSSRRFPGFATSRSPVAFPRRQHVTRTAATICRMRPPSRTREPPRPAM